MEPPVVALKRRRRHSVDTRAHDPNWVTMREYHSGTEEPFLFPDGCLTRTRVQMAVENVLYKTARRPDTGMFVVYTATADKPYNATLVAKGRIHDGDLSTTLVSDALPDSGTLYMICIPGSRRKDRSAVFQDFVSNTSIEIGSLVLDDRTVTELLAIAFCLRLLRGKPVTAVPESMRVLLYDKRRDKHISITQDTPHVGDLEFFKTLDTTCPVHFFMQPTWT